VSFAASRAPSKGGPGGLEGDFNREEGAETAEQEKATVRDEQAIERPEKGGEASFIRYVVRTATGPASPPLGQGCEL